MMPLQARPAESSGPGQLALAYASLGWRVLPIKPGEKRPPMNSWQTFASNEPKNIVNWFKNLYRGFGVGVATGEASNVWVLDVDTGPDKPGDASVAALEAEHGPLPATVEAVTGSGGRHLYFLWPEGEKVITRRDTKATTSPLPAGIDVRGDGGQVLAPPTIHPNGTVYAWREGRSPWDIEVAEAPDWLLEIVCDREAPAPEPPSAAPPTSSFLLERDHYEDDSIAEWHNERTDWESMLKAEGWTPLKPSGSQQYWVRPGKEKKDGHSATLHLPDGPFVIFSTDGTLTRYAHEWARIKTGDGWAFSRFGFYAATKHDGDRSRAARQLRQLKREQERPTAPGVPTQSDQPGAPSSWQRVELDDYLDGNYEPVLPVLLVRTDGQPILYKGRVNGLFGESGAGKSWVALLATAERLLAGEAVVYIDLEDHPPAIIHRLVALGVTHDQIRRHLRYVQPDSPATRDDVEAIDLMCRDATLVVIDSLGEATAMQGVEENRGDQFAVWNTKFARHWASLGPAVLTLDHLPKSEEAPSLFAVGTQRKKAAIDGVLIRVDQVESFDKKKAGRLKLTCAKDRNGTFHRGEVITEVSITPADDAVSMVLGVPPARDEEGKVERPTVLMERVSTWLQLYGPESKRTVVKEVRGNETYVAKALDVLVAEGWVTAEPRQGRGGGFQYRSERPYRDDSDPLKPVDNSQLSSVAKPSPTVSLAAEQDSVELSPPFITEGGQATVRGTSELELSPEETDDWEAPF